MTARGALGFVFGSVAGVAAGVAAGLLLAPRSGAESRAMAADAVNDAWDSAVDAYERGTRVVNEKVSAVRPSVDATSDELRAKVDLARERMDQLRDSLSETVATTSAQVQDAVSTVTEKVTEVPPTSSRPRRDRGRGRPGRGRRGGPRLTRPSPPGEGPMLKLSQMTGVAVYGPKGSHGKAANTFTRVGKVHQTVFSPDGLRVVGFFVARPDIAGMVKREDAFVALDAMAPCDGGVRVTMGAESFDDAARAPAWSSIGTSACIWAGMDAKTTEGKVLGFVSDAEFNSKTGEVSSFFVGDGGMAQSLVGSVQIPASMLRGYEKGWMLVAPEAARMELSGGVAGKAGESYAKAKYEGKKVAEKAGKAAGEAVDKGSKALGKQLGRTKGMFSSFMDEFKKAQE